MSKGPLVLWLLTELWGLYLTPAAAQTVVRAFAGQSATLPCAYSSWSSGSNSMCWGKGPCPKSKCTEELLHTDGWRVTSRRSTKYVIQGEIQRGDVSLTIFNTNEGDSAVYCCRIEVPGWFNDVKKNIRLQIRKAPTTTRRPTTRRPPTTTTTTTTTAMATPTTTLPTTVMTAPDFTPRTPLPTRTTAALSVMTTTCPLTTPSPLPETAKTLPTAEPSTAEPMLTAESKGWILQSTSQALLSKRREPGGFSQPEGSETTTFVQVKVEQKQIGQVDGSPLLKIIVSSLGLALSVCALTVAFLFRGKVMKTNCFNKHIRLDNAGESKRHVLDDDIQHGREDEEGLFTL
ncbi:T-cell immunoglobulin and mucin domain-containing protein 4 isoform X2 [Pteronotus mesoamericanus]|uniref:T-cell immunoglobulin and mucin domain-containing protein 4 isoform X2 n=1 Tax=Pteronotus mesoamericanus TaxID=1884717 RepID=UPI0023ED0CEC|nr:T-cell immunoglobulin and mucin domain-containing protein 4 isoform X2 [Pteronotus parnellii mesoamericanus]